MDADTQHMTQPDLTRQCDLFTKKCWHGHIEDTSITLHTF